MHLATYRLCCFLLSSEWLMVLRAKIVGNASLFCSTVCLTQLRVYENSCYEIVALRNNHLTRAAPPESHIIHSGKGIPCLIIHSPIFFIINLANNIIIFRCK